MYWDGNDKWFKGEVKDYAPTTQKHLVKYEDNDTQWLILAQEEQLGQLRWLDGKPPRGGGKAKEEEKKPRAKKSNAYSMGPSWKCEKCGFVNMDMMNHGRRTICFMRDAAARRQQARGPREKLEAQVQGALLVWG